MPTDHIDAALVDALDKAKQAVSDLRESKGNSRRLDSLADAIRNLVCARYNLVAALNEDA